MTNSNLFDFLRGLTEDPQKLADFENDPQQAMMTAGLTEEEMEAVVGGNETALTDFLGEDTTRAIFRISRFRIIRIRRFRF